MDKITFNNDENLNNPLEVLAYKKCKKPNIPNKGQFPCSDYNSYLVAKKKVYYQVRKEYPELGKIIDHLKKIDTLAFNSIYKTGKVSDNILKLNNYYIKLLEARYLDFFNFMDEYPSGQYLMISIGFKNNPFNDFQSFVGSTPYNKNWPKNINW